VQKVRTQIDQDRYNKAVVDYHKWRAATIKLFQSKTDVMSFRTDEIEADALGRRPRGHLSDLISESGRNKSRELCAKRLIGIVIDAIAMDLEMRMQRAMLFLHSSRAFDSKCMAMEPLDSDRGEYFVESQEVGLVVRPALIKIGNWDGEGFNEAPETLVHSAVVPVNALARARQRIDYTSDSGDSKKRSNSRTRKPLW
jgi:hypothetical protein